MIARWKLPAEKLCKRARTESGVETRYRGIRPPRRTSVARRARHLPESTLSWTDSHRCLPCRQKTENNSRCKPCHVGHDVDLLTAGSIESQDRQPRRQRHKKCAPAMRMIRAQHHAD